MALDPDSDELGRLAIETGGLLAVENARLKWTTYHLSDDGLKRMETTAHRFLSQIILPYRVQLSTAAPDKREELSIGLSVAIKQKAPGASVLFPHQLATCSSAKSP